VQRKQRGEKGRSDNAAQGAGLKGHTGQPVWGVRKTSAASQ
jgi:hypothetical protein